MISCKKRMFSRGRKLLALVWAMSATAAFACRTICGGIEERVDEVLSRLTLEQKIGQTWQCLGRETVEPASSDMSGEKLKESFLAGVRTGRYGSVIGKCGVENYNAIQRAAMEGVGIPLLIGSDMIHSAATTYPIPLALACSWDESLWERVAAVDAAANRALSREAAQKSVVLLKNEDGTLPLKNGVKVALLGDIAASDRRSPHGVP